MTRQRVAAVRRHIEATLGPGDQLLLSTRMVSTSNAFEVRGEGEVATFPRFVSVRFCQCCKGVPVQVLVAGRLVHSRSRGDGLVDTQAKITNILSAVSAALQLHS